MRAWDVLQSIPIAETRSYSWMAEQLGIPGARRAVGRANGTNMICLIIPCHRVIRETGALGHYHWDPIRKRAIVGWELSGRNSIELRATDRIRASAA